MNLSGKVGLVTGAANGIGLAIAERFIAEGMALVAMDTDEAGLDQACRYVCSRTPTDRNGRW